MMKIVKNIEPLRKRLQKMKLNRLSPLLPQNLFILPIALKVKNRRFMGLKFKPNQK
jgi:hypothetical protein